MTLEDAIFEKLIHTTAISSRVGSRFYRGWRPHNGKLPCVTFGRVTTEPVNSAAGVETTTRITMQVDVWAANQRTARTIADAIRSALGGWTHTSSPTVSPANLINETDMTEGGEPGTQLQEHRVSQDWAMWGTV